MSRTLLARLPTASLSAGRVAARATSTNEAAHSHGLRTLMISRAWLPGAVDSSSLGRTPPSSARWLSSSSSPSPDSAAEDRSGPRVYLENVPLSVAESDIVDTLSEVAGAPVLHALMLKPKRGSLVGRALVRCADKAAADAIVDATQSDQGLVVGGVEVMAKHHEAASGRLASLQKIMSSPLRSGRRGAPQDAVEQQFASTFVADGAAAPTVDEEAALAMLSQGQRNKLAVAEALKGEQRHATDVGSAEAQVAALTARVEYLTAHMQKHRKDKHSLRGLRHVLNRRRKALREVSKRSMEEYRALVDRLGIRDIIRAENEAPTFMAKKQRDL